MGCMYCYENRNVRVINFVGEVRRKDEELKFQTWANIYTEHQIYRDMEYLEIILVGTAKGF